MARHSVRDMFSMTRAQLRAAELERHMHGIHPRLYRSASSFREMKAAHDKWHEEAERKRAANRKKSPRA